MDSMYLTDILCNEESCMPINIVLTKLVNHTKTLKNYVRTIIEDESIQFKPILKESVKLKYKAEELLGEMNLVENNIDGNIKEELSNCAEELKVLSCSLREVNLMLNIIKQLLEINSLLKKAEEKLFAEEYYECAELVTIVKNLVNDNSEKLKKIEIFKILSQEVTIMYEQLLHKLSEIWSDYIKFNIVDDEYKTSIIFSINSNSAYKIQQILTASSYLKSNLMLKKFSKKLLNNILNKIILQKTKLQIKSENGSEIILEISKSNDKPNYLEVFENIKVIIKFLKTNLDIKIQDNDNFLSQVGDYIAQDFTESLIKNFLSEAIPNNLEDFDNFKNIIVNAEEFEKTLQSIGFLPSNSSSLMDYAKNVNYLFANKFCQSFLNKARLIMKKDLHNVTYSDEVVSHINVLPSTYGAILKNKMNIPDEEFIFPKSRISKHADELMNLIKLIMREILKCTEMCAIRLFYTIRNIFEMYSAIVPLHHKKFLETLPQQVALFHNNCMYFAHNLIHIAIEFQNKISGILKNHIYILLEESVLLRCLAAEKLQSAVTNQRNQLIYILRNSGFATLNENPILDPNSEKSVRQCLRQIQILKNVWQDILPPNIYNRAIGFLVDALAEELIELIISVEDISSQTACDLVSTFGIILERAPNLLLEGKEIHQHSKKWQKFKEFVLIIKGSLRDIDDRWANGMGPLAAEFTADQVKHLIRALFQNSDRRAALLARIRQLE